MLGCTKTLFTTDSSSLLTSSTEKNTVSITSAQSTTKNALNSSRNSLIPSAAHISRLRYNTEVPRRYPQVGEGGRMAENDHYQACYSSPASSPTRANSNMSTTNRSILNPSYHHCTPKIQQRQLIQISPVSSNASSSWQNIDTVSGKSTRVYMPKTVF